MKKSRKAQDKSNILTSAWKRLHPEKHSALNNGWHHRNKGRIKKECLTHYGKGGKLKCCWEGCSVHDIDLLTLDHIKNNGREDRAKDSIKGGHHLYYRLMRLKWPKGFQTLCWNHQWKKELMRQRRKNGR